jgi:molybdate transport system substrate-binding protein
MSQFRLPTLASLVALVAFLGLPQTRAAELTVFAAASLSDALQALAPAYTAETGDTLRFSFGASNILARQLQAGAPADVFFSADEARMDQLARADLLLPETRRTLLSNTLVLIVPAEDGLALAAPADLATPRVTRLALAEPHTVPAGLYAKAWLEQLGLWPALQPKVIPTENVRACLATVAAGNAEVGIVYRSDALSSPSVKIAYEVPRAEGPAIAYPIAVLRRSPEALAAARFCAYLARPEALAVFTRHGFLVPAPSPGG